MHRKRNSPQVHSTTVLCVRRDSKVVLAADGQVTLGEGVIKHNAKKTRRLYNDKILAGFAGSTADALSLFQRFENKLQEFHGNLSRAAVELAKDWRTDRSLRHLDALLVVADSADEKAYVPALEKRGYLLRIREPDWHEHLSATES